MSASIRKIAHHSGLAAKAWLRREQCTQFGAPYVAHQSAKWQRAAKYAARDQFKTRGR